MKATMLSMTILLIIMSMSNNLLQFGPAWIVLSFIYATAWVRSNYWISIMTQLYLYRLGISPLEAMFILYFCQSICWCVCWLTSRVFMHGRIGLFMLLHATHDTVIRLNAIFYLTLAADDTALTLTTLWLQGACGKIVRERFPESEWGSQLGFISGTSRIGSMAASLLFSGVLRSTRTVATGYVSTKLPRTTIGMISTYSSMQL